MSQSFVSKILQPSLHTIQFESWNWIIGTRNFYYDILIILINEIVNHTMDCSDSSLDTVSIGNDESSIIDFVTIVTFLAYLVKSTVYIG